MVEDSLDPLQFAYRARCGVEDATVTLLNLVLKHLEGTKTHILVEKRFSFGVDF